MTPIRTFVLSLAALMAPLASADEKSSGNPVFEGWYADPEGIIFGDRYWIYPTYSAPYN